MCYKDKILTYITKVKQSISVGQPCSLTVCFDLVNFMYVGAIEEYKREKQRKELKGILEPKAYL